MFTRDFFGVYILAHLCSIRVLHIQFHKQQLCEELWSCRQTSTVTLCGNLHVMHTKICEILWLNWVVYF